MSLPMASITLASANKLRKKESKVFLKSSRNGINQLVSVKDIFKKEPN